jgi:hypothetical protein
MWPLNDHARCVFLCECLISAVGIIALLHYRLELGGPRFESVSEDRIS